MIWVARRCADGILVGGAGLLVKPPAKFDFAAAGKHDRKIR
jgi:hypothetical protein